MTELVNPGPHAAPPSAPAEERYMVPGLMRGLAVLEAFSPEQPSLSLAELGRAVGLPRSTAYRLVYTLAELGFLEREGNAKTYRLGPRVLGLGFSYLSSLELVDIARPSLTDLRDRTNCSAHLALLQGTDVLYVARVPAQKMLNSWVQVGSRLPAHATSMGRAILSRMAESNVRTLFQKAELKRYSDETATSVDDLMVVLETDRSLGYAASLSSFEDGIASLAVAIMNEAEEPIGAINVTTPQATLRGDELESEIKDAVLAAAADISRWFGKSSAAQHAV
jgi:DNA-binding IclR family transcriptional regulator